MTWSRLAGSRLYRLARAAQDDPKRRYHNFHHVARLYAHAAATLDLAYDADLDHAILTHDVVYDGEGDAERRSADWLASAAPERDNARSMAMIMQTAEHRLGDDNRIVLLDLADLAVPSLVEGNRARIRAELRTLKGVDDLAFARGNLAYFEALAGRLDPAGIALSRAETTLLERIHRGIDQVIALSRREIDDHSQGEGRRPASPETR